MVTIKPIQANDTYHLRHTVLRPHQSLEDCIYQGDRDATTIHLGAFLGDKLISIGSFIQESYPELDGNVPYRLRGMATDPSYRRQKAGSTLMSYAEKLLKRKECDLLWFNARYGVKDYYLYMGFQAIEEIFEIESFGPHIVMYKNL